MLFVDYLELTKKYWNNGIVEIMLKGEPHWGEGLPLRKSMGWCRGEYTQANLHTNIELTDLICRYQWMADLSSLDDYSVSTEIRLSLGSPNRDSGPLVFSSQVMVWFFSGVLELAVTGAREG